jgi:hypothetical protein
LDFFFVVESVVWSLVLAWGFASAGIIESANNRDRPAIHVLILMGSLFIGSSFDEGRMEQPRLRTAGSPSSASEGQARERGWDVVRPRPDIMPVREHRGQVRGKMGGIKTALKRSGTSVRKASKTMWRRNLPPLLRLIDDNKLSRPF